MRYEIGQRVFYIFNNRVRDGLILARKTVVMNEDTYNTSESFRKSMDKFGTTGVTYLVSGRDSAVYGETLFPSREELLASL
jgi:hypothetical protein